MPADEPPTFVAEPDADVELTEILSQPGPGASFAGSSAAGAPGVPGTHRPPSSRYELLGTVGKGGMGLVYLARDVDLRRKVALKQLGPEASARADAVTRFVQEVQITAQLDHPQIVPVYGLEAGPNGELSYAMKLVNGKTFAQIVDETRATLAAGEALDEEHGLPARLEHFLKVCDAVSYAHGKGVLHRDLKPANLMVGRYNEVYVMDWGLARLIGRRGHPAVELRPLSDVDSGAAETRLGTIVGTPRYMSPEQVSAPSDRLDGRSDEYALGLVLFELVTLAPAVRGTTLAEYVEAARDARTEPMVPAVAGADVPPPLAAIVQKATSRRPEDRYASVRDLAADVRRYLRDEPILARPDTPVQRLGRFVARHRRGTLAALAGLALLAAFVGALGLWRHEVQREEARLKVIRTERFVSDVGRGAQLIDAHFHHLHGLLQGFAGAAEQALLNGVPSREPFFTAADFADPARRPADAFRSARYGGFVSGASSAWWVPAGAGPEVTGALARLLPLQRARRRLFLESQGRGASADQDVPSHELLDGADLPVLWTLLGMPSGLASVYPGSDRLPVRYDATKRPWYRIGEKAVGVACGAPHQDRFGTGLILSCGTPLHDLKGGLLGVVALDLSLERTASALVKLRGHPSVEECFVLDASGGILVRSRDDAAAKFDAEGWELIEPFPYLGAVPALTSEPSGVAHVEAAGRSLVIVWRRLDSLRFTYAVVADVERLEREDVAVRKS